MPTPLSRMLISTASPRSRVDTFRVGFAQRAAARAGDKIAQPRHQLVERKLVSLADRRAYEATATERDCRADMNAAAGLKPRGSPESVKFPGLTERARDRFE